MHSHSHSGSRPFGASRKRRGESRSLCRRTGPRRSPGAHGSLPVSATPNCTSKAWRSFHWPPALALGPIRRVEAIGPERDGRRATAWASFLDSYLRRFLMSPQAGNEFCPKQANFGYSLHGALTDYALAPAAGLVRVPEQLAAGKAAPLCCAPAGRRGARCGRRTSNRDKPARTVWTRRPGTSGAADGAPSWIARGGSGYLGIKLEMAKSDGAEITAQPRTPGARRRSSTAVWTRPASIRRLRRDRHQQAFRSPEAQWDAGAGGDLRESA